METPNPAAILRSLTPDQLAALAKQIDKMVTDLDDDADRELRQRKRGLVRKEDMVFTITCHVRCRACGTTHKSETKSSDRKDVHTTVATCNVCVEVLSTKTVSELVTLIIERAKAEAGIDNSYKDYRHSYNRGDE